VDPVSRTGPARPAACLAPEQKVGCNHEAMIILATGWSEPGSLGVVGYAPDGEEAARRRVAAHTGAVVANVIVRSTADRLDLRIDDAIVELNGNAIARFADLTAAVEKTRLADEAHVAYIREGTRREVKGVLGPRIGEPFLKLKT
jgi:S1-C subfamily serine protease